MNGELLRRVVVALIGAPIAIALIWYGDAALATLASALAAIGAWEFFRMARAAGSQPFARLGVLMAALLPLSVHATFLGVIRPELVHGVMVLLALMALALWRRGPTRAPAASIATTVLGVAYTGGTLSFVYALRYHPYAVGDLAGALVVLLPVALTWASDTGAYFSGRAIGGAKLMPSVSPGKTVAGAVGAVVLTVVVTWLFVRFALQPHAHLAFTTAGTLLFGAAVSVTAQVGDLVESMFKREAGVKDSGTLFPGHGGVLDRLDSIFFVLPVAYVLYDLLLIAVPA